MLISDNGELCYIIRPYESKRTIAFFLNVEDWKVNVNYLQLPILAQSDLSSYHLRQALLMAPLQN